MLREVSRPAPMRAKQLAGSVAVVTGSTSGSGLGIARALAAARAAVVPNGLDKIDDVGEILADIAPEFSVRAIYSPADMARLLCRSAVSLSGDTSMPFRCASGEFTKNQEPTLDALLGEPIMRLVMARDGVSEAEIRTIAAEARANIDAGETGDNRAEPSGASRARSSA